MKSLINDIAKVMKVNVKLVQNRYKILEHLIQLKKFYFLTIALKTPINKGFNEVIENIKEY